MKRVFTMLLLASLMLSSISALATEIQVEPYTVLHLPWGITSEELCNDYGFGISESWGENYSKDATWVFEFLASPNIKIWGIPAKIFANCKVANGTTELEMNTAPRYFYSIKVPFSSRARSNVKESILLPAQLEKELVKAYGQPSSMILRLSSDISDDKLPNTQGNVYQVPLLDGMVDWDALLPYMGLYGTTISLSIDFHNVHFSFSSRGEETYDTQERFALIDHWMEVRDLTSLYIRDDLIPFTVFQKNFEAVHQILHNAPVTEMGL